MPFTYEEVLNAYIKLKAYIYYDSSNLFMREQLAIFETNLPDNREVFAMKRRMKSWLEKYEIEADDELEVYEIKLKIFTSAINQHHQDRDYFNHFLGKIVPRLMPKKIQEPQKPSRIITNQRTAESYAIERSLVFIDVPIELHLISVLWILRHGYKLDRALSNSCFGNRLLLNKAKNAVVQGSGLFKPYQRQYQKWRDGAVDCARQILAEETDVLMLNLDIRDFFYSVRIPLKLIEQDYQMEQYEPNPANNLIQIFSQIHQISTRIISADLAVPYRFDHEVEDIIGEVEKFILPIGLLSSFILANHHLKDFDTNILSKAHPAYFGRYVDDILMVLVNPVMPDDQKNQRIPALNFNFESYRRNLEVQSDDEGLSEADFEKLWDIEKIVLENFYPIISLIDKPLFLVRKENEKPSHFPSDERVFKINGYERLYCQSDKTLLYYFDKDESSLVIDKLKRDLEEKSSEFRNYEDVDDEQAFEESAYHLLYDGTEGKIRTLKDYKEDRFGLTVYLSKKIFNTLRQQDKISDEEADKIVRFFKGKNTISLYTLWERVFVYLLVNDKPTKYIEFYANCVKAITAIDPSIQLRISAEDYQAGVLKYLHAALEVSLSLDPSFLARIDEIRQRYEFYFNSFKIEHEFFNRKYSPTNEDSFFIARYRKSNLVRHHFVAQPLISYTVDDFQMKNYTSIKLDY